MAGVAVLVSISRSVCLCCPYEPLEEVFATKTRVDESRILRTRPRGSRRGLDAEEQAGVPRKCVHADSRKYLIAKLPICMEILILAGVF